MVKLIYKDDKPVGWEMCPTTDEEQQVVGIIRDLQFFGFDKTHIVYDGLKLIDPEKGKCMGNVKSISWIQQQHSS